MMKKKIPNQTSVLRLLVLLVAVLSIYSIESRLTIVSTDSINATILWRTSDNPQKEDYVNYENVSHPETAQRITVTKQVRCVSGDVLQVKGLDYYCNGILLGRAKTVSKTGKPLTPFVWNGVIPPGDVFVMGEHQDSWDSRYWGFAKLHQAEKVNKLM